MGEVPKMSQTPELDNNAKIDANEVQSILKFLNNSDNTKIQDRMDQKGMEKGDTNLVKIVEGLSLDDIKDLNIDDKKAYLNVINYLSSNPNIKDKSKKSLENLDNEIKKDILVDIAYNELLEIYKKRIGPNEKVQDFATENIRETAQKIVEKKLQNPNLNIDTYYNEQIMHTGKKLGVITSYPDKKNAINEVIADNNRSYLLGQFALAFPDYLNNPDLHTEDFAAILENTDNNTIKDITMAIASYPDAEILKNLWTSMIQTNNGKFYEGTKFLSSNILGDHKSINTPTYIPGILNGRYTQQVKDKSESITKTIEAPQERMITEGIVDALKNINTTNIEIQLSDPTLAPKVSEIIARITNTGNIPINIEIVKGLDNLKIETTEKVETPTSIKANLDNLEANKLGPNGSIEKILNSNLKLRNIMLDPNYTIVGGTVTGFASRNTTKYTNEDPIDFGEYDANVDLDPYVNEKNNSEITNNPELAYNRAASFIDYFLSQDNKVRSGSSFNLKHEVIGPSREDIIAQFKNSGNEKPNDDQIKEAFLPYQKVFIDLSLIKTEYKTSTKDIDLTNIENSPGKDIVMTLVIDKAKPMSPPKGRMNLNSPNPDISPGKWVSKDLARKIKNSCTSFGKNNLMSL